MVPMPPTSRYSSKGDQPSKGLSCSLAKHKYSKYVNYQVKQGDKKKKKRTRLMTYAFPVEHHGRLMYNMER